jgi:MFS family permease
MKDNLEVNMKNNIKLLYGISFFNNLWFWLGIWALYYLLFTNYTGIGIIETAMIVSVVVFEIPSGALADLFGKRKILILAFLVVAFSEFIMAGAVNFWMLMFSAIVGSLGITMVSGTFEAITYDSLMELGKEKIYDKILSRQKSIKYVASALATIAGGAMYTYGWHRMPFILVGVMSLIACILALFLKEPKIKTKLDESVLSWNIYWQQLRQGFKQLFSQVKFRAVVIVLFVAGIVPLFMYEMVEDILLVAYGATAMEISGEVFLESTATALVIHFTSLIVRKIGGLRGLVIIAFIYAGLLPLVSFVGLGGAIALIVVWGSFNTINQIITSKLINDQTPSENRATTLSTFNMLLSLPYILMATWIGFLADKYTVQDVVFWLGIVMFISLVVSVGNLWLKRRK